MRYTKSICSLALASALLLGTMPAMAEEAVTVETVDTTKESSIPQRPDGGTSQGNPFAKGNGGSTSFRIPAMVSLDDGTLVAAADARWNTTYDGGGLDTMTAYSKDNGKTWTYQFANYLGDNGDVYNGRSTAFIDPELATDGSNVYMLCDLYPYGVALNGQKDTTPDTALGFDENGNLKLSSDGKTYDKYLNNGKIYDASGEIEGYTVDEYFNIFKDGTYVSNLFFEDSPYTVVRTGYLYLTKSTDKGKTWSAPKLLNLKTDNEMVCLAGPGRGLVTSDGTIIFSVYSYNGGDSSQRNGFVYSKDGGETWKRTNSDVNWSSESAAVELKDGTIRVFIRNGSGCMEYVDYKDGKWGEAVNTEIPVNSNTQMSAIVLKNTLEGNQIIAVSCPAGPNAAGSSSSNGAYRSSGKVFFLMVKPDNTLKKLDEIINVTPVVNGAFDGALYDNGFFAYSCLSQLPDGSLALLYEDSQNGWGAGDDRYYTIAYKHYDNNIEFTKTRNVSLTVGQIYTKTVSGSWEDSYTGKDFDKSIADITVKSVKVKNVTNLSSSKNVYLQNSKGRYINNKGKTVKKLENASDWTAIRTKNGYIFKSGKYYLKSGKSSAEIVKSASKATVFNYDKNTAAVSDSTKTVAFAVRPISSKNIKTYITIKGLKKGSSDVMIGDTKYKISVYDEN